MKILLWLGLLVTTSAAAQSTFHARIVDAQSRAPLPGATLQISPLNLGSAADEQGVVTLANIPDGTYTLLFRFIGYQPTELRYAFPRPVADTLQIRLVPSGEELGEITVSATRSSRTISDIPTRLEIISAGELEEKAVMQPGNIRMLLTESTGIQTQQTSATSANATIRIQGLDGRYTQLLQDGFPLYSGFAGGLSILQIPPLNLKRVEVIKGSSSTLYGGGAIAGLINLVTKEPTSERELMLLANGNQTRALDLSGFYSQKLGKLGLTLYAARNSQVAYDVNADGFSDLPRYTRYTVSPKAFLYLNPTTTVSFGLNGTVEDRLGGDMQVIAGRSDSTHRYIEGNQSDRFSTQFKLDKILATGAVFTVKNSIGYFAREITRPVYRFGGHQLASYSEVSYSHPATVLEWVAGANLWTDTFRQANPSGPALDYTLNTIGLFGQSNWKPSARFVLETGLRLDYVRRGSSGKSNLLVLPRISALVKVSASVTVRAGGGLGYKALTIFTEEAEEQGFQNLRPVDGASTRNETSIGGNMDVNYRTPLFDAVSLSVNQLFFYTRLNHPLRLSSLPASDGTYRFYNADGRTLSTGIETNVKLTYNEVAVYLGYTYINARTDEPLPQGQRGSRPNPFTSRHRLYSTLLYELNEKLRIGYELFYVGRQTIRNGTVKPSYWMMGLSAERRWRHVSLFVNFENFLDARQSRFEPVYTGSVQNPQFADIWAPTEGVIYNGGFKFTL
ncbi:TonB-dependent receptor [Nibrella viscosa]|uniref:TonB-dependent receptor n=1 Tax=Nibrella viscosa TaxID=1084524 RepID=A0ABP8KNM1_9BACT